MSGNVLNFNVGILGHIDSGKTSLSKALSTVASTASFDKNPQSRERGITIDLGFSSFNVPVPDHIKSDNPSLETLQFTLVDCPGHASLIRTIIGGAQIIDMIMLVVDVTKGIQTQTAECLIIAEITCNHMIVVLNKIDLIAADKREQTIQKMSKKIMKTLEKTKFKDTNIIAVAASPNDTETALGISNLIDTLRSKVFIPLRSDKDPFIFAVDHCFAIKGQGTIMTGTILQGCVSVSDLIEIPSIKETRKVKSIQMFKKPVTKAMQGDRVGICVTQFDAKLLERGVICAPGYMEAVDAAIVSVAKIPYFKGNCTTNSKFHVSILHDTLMAKCSFFGLLDCDSDCSADTFNYNLNYVHLDSIEPKLTEEKDTKQNAESLFALLHFDRSVILNENSTYIASRLETDIHANLCRLAFHGKILSARKSDTEIFSSLKVYNEKMKEGVVDRMVNDYQVIVRDLFKKETNIQIFINLKVTLSTGEAGVIEGSFGQSGKVNVRIPNGLNSGTKSQLSLQKKDKTIQNNPIRVTLKFKKFLYGTKKNIFQT
uniref:Selenocysteine-specific elongation factor n=1 Tax=Parasteatoda tepidariorum TaxID=114398 RepID=A0A2L2YM74_PARTP